MNCDHSNVPNRATKQSFPVVLFIMLYKVVLTSSLWMKALNVAIIIKVTEQHFPVVLLKVCCIYEREKNSVE